MGMATPDFGDSQGYLMTKRNNRNELFKSADFRAFYCDFYMQQCSVKKRWSFRVRQMWVLSSLCYLYAKLVNLCELLFNYKMAAMAPPPEIYCGNESLLCALHGVGTWLALMNTGSSHPSVHHTNVRLYYLQQEIWSSLSSWKAEGLLRRHLRYPTEDWTGRSMSSISFPEAEVLVSLLDTFGFYCPATLSFRHPLKCQLWVDGVQTVLFPNVSPAPYIGPGTQ